MNRWIKAKTHGRCACCRTKYFHGEDVYEVGSNVANITDYRERANNIFCSETCAREYAVEKKLEEKNAKSL